jgi:coenzyme F420-0:L-glutamate ligase / coenzyme F420-1:gamma-L-glutamate ligase
MSVELTAVTGLGEVVAGDDLAALLVAALAAAGTPLQDGDVLLISSKVVSKAEGRAVAALDREAQIVAATVRPVASRRTPAGLTRIVESVAGPVMAAAGVDASNVAPGTVLLLPKDPDGSARAVREQLHRLTGAVVGVVLTDTAGRAWRDGQTDFALGAAGIVVTDDLRGGTDTHGQRLEVTVRALADELAAAGDLVKGKLAGAPAALVRGLPDLVTPEDGPGAAVLLRRVRDDWFRLGHVEAVRAALGVPDDAVPAPTIPPGPTADRLARVIELAMTGSPPWAPQESWAATARVELTPDGARWSGAGPVLGALAQRLSSAAWSEDLPIALTITTPTTTTPSVLTLTLILT